MSSSSSSSSSLAVKQELQHKIAAILEAQGVRSYPLTVDKTSPAFPLQFAWVLMGIFSHKTRVRAFLREDVARSLVPAITSHILKHNTVSSGLCPALAKIEALRAVRIDGFHTTLFKCAKRSWDACNEPCTAETLTKVLQFLEDLRPLKPLCIGDFKHQAWNTYVFSTSFGDVQIGAPPEALKYCNTTGSSAQSVPRIYVLPPAFFTGGMNYGESEFPVFFNYYILKAYFNHDHKALLIGAGHQLEKMRNLFREAVFGPTEENMYMTDDISPQSLASGYSINLTAERNALVSYTEGGVADFPLTSYAEFHPFDASGEVSMTLRRRMHPPTPAASTMSATATTQTHITPSATPTPSASSSVPSTPLSDDLLPPPAAKAIASEGILKVVNTAGLIQIYEDGQLKGVLDSDFVLVGGNIPCPAPGLPVPSEHLNFHPPSFGITFLGTSHGFDSHGRTTGFVIWVNGNGIMVDPPFDAHYYLTSAGVRGLVTRVILTHAHSDHDGGIARLLVAGERMTLYTTKTIHESYRRKLNAIDGKDWRQYYDFFPVRVGEQVPIGGANFEFDYSFHTIPTIGFQVHYRGRSISYSADTKYDPELYPDLVHKKVMTPAREASLRMRGFDADIIIHEMGMPPIHTEVRVLNNLPMSIKRKMLVVHCSEVPDSFRAPDGTTVTVTGLLKPSEGLENTIVVPLGDFEEGYTRASRRLQLLCSSPFLRSLSAQDVYMLFAAVSEVRFSAGSPIVRAGDPPLKNTLYVIEEGKAEMYGGSLSTVSPPVILDPGDMFGHSEDGTTSITAKTDVIAVSFSAEILAKLPRIGNEILRVLKFRSFIHASLAKNALFRDLSREQLAVFSSCVSEEVRLSKNERLIRQGDISDRSFYIIRDGSVRVERVQGDPPTAIEFARLGPGQLVGEIAMLLGKPRNANVIANEPTTLFKVKKEAFDEVLERYPNIRFAMNAMVDRRVDDVSRVDHISAPSPSGAGAAAAFKHFT